MQTKEEVEDCRLRDARSRVCLVTARSIGRGQPHSKTLRKGWRPIRRGSVLECGCPLPLSSLPVARVTLSNLKKLSRPQQLPPVLRRRLAENLFEHAVEVRQRLETDFKRDFTDAQVRIEQQVFRLLDANA